MRSLEARKRRLLVRVAALSLIAGAMAGCSSDFTRFDKTLLTGATDPVTTGSTETFPADGQANAVAPGTTYVGAPQPLNDVALRPIPPDYADPNAAAYSSQYPATQNPSAVERSSLPSPGAVTSSPASDDGVIPAVVQNPAQANLSRRPKDVEPGWSNSGGSMVTLREGETLYNLSKRFGVPVPDIMKANGVKDATQVRPGQQILIPSYNYSADAPISAPDNNARTRNASARVGSIDALPPEAVPVPEKAPYRVASAERPAQVPSKKSVAQAPDGLVTGSPSKEPQIDEQARAELPRPYTKPEAKATDAEEKTASAPAQTGIGEFRWPVRGKVIANFGDKIASGRNDGIDISVPEGTAVKAAENGVVVYAGSELEGFGNLVLIKHSGGWVSAYAHNKTIEVARGAEVKRGEIIARSGRSGSAEMPKLHFELRRNSVPVDPLKHLGAV